MIGDSHIMGSEGGVFHTCMPECNNCELKRLREEVRLLRGPNVRITVAGEVVPEWVLAWAAFQKGQQDTNLALEIEARARLNELATEVAFGATTPTRFAPACPHE
jgi:hypothetical protein